MPRRNRAIAWAVIAAWCCAPLALAAPPERMAAIPAPANTTLPGVRDAGWNEKSLADSAAKTPAAPQTAPVPLAPANARRAPALAPPNQSGATAGAKTGSSVWTVLGSLGVVLGLFLAVVWLLRRGMPTGAPPLPKEVVEVLGRAPLGNRQHMHLVRWGNKLLLVNVTPGGAETLAEIAEQAEVDRLAGLCREANPQSATASFKQMFHQLARARHRPGFVDADAAPPAPPPRIEPNLRSPGGPRHV